MSAIKRRWSRPPGALSVIHRLAILLVDHHADPPRELALDVSDSSVWFLLRNRSRTGSLITAYQGEAHGGSSYPPTYEAVTAWVDEEERVPGDEFDTGRRKAE